MKASRRVLALATASHLALTVMLHGQILTHGPVVGGVTDSEAKVFVRTDQAATVAIQYSIDPDLQSPAVSPSVVTNEASDFTTIISLSGLTAETPYYLNVLVNDVPQFSVKPYPVFTTFPPVGSSRDFNFAVLADFGTVAKLTADVQTFISASADLPAFAFIGGDFDHSNPQTLSDKRQMFKNLYNPNTRYMSQFVPLILRRMAIVHQWDDHDSGLNNLDKNYPDWPLTQQAFQEYTPTYPLPAVTPGIWQKFRYAQAECFVLDCRSQRDNALDPNDVNKSMLDGNNLGASGELEWLKNGLLTSTARWKIIFTSVITNPTTKQNDAWGAYPTEWNSLKSFIVANNITNVVFIAGDLHLGAIDNGTQAGFPEMCVAAANQTRTGFCATAATGTWSEGYYDDTCAGYGLVSVLQNPDRLILQVADQWGTIHVAYTVTDQSPPPTPTPTPSPTPTPTQTPTPTATPTATPEAPRIIQQPASKSVDLGETATFSVVASGTQPMSYQWKKNDLDIPGAILANYTTPPAVAKDNGSLFSVVVSNVAGSVTSAAKVLNVNLPPLITKQPVDKSVKAGRTATFTVAASGRPPLTYHWRKDGVEIPEATNPSYTTPPATSEDNGATFSVEVTNSLGDILSNDAILTVR